MESQLLAPPTVYEYLSVHDTSKQYDALRPYKSKKGRPTSTAPKSSLGRTHSLSKWKLHRRLSVSPQSPVSQTSVIYEIPHLTKTPWELGRKRSHSTPYAIAPQHLCRTPVWKKLPTEVCTLIVSHLEQLHLHEEQSRPSCHLRDLSSLCLTSRTWNRAATPKLYRKVWVLASEERPRMPKLKITGTGRVKLLRRTLRERPALANLVRELELSYIKTLYENASIEKEEILNQVASLVMACPNLECLTGFHVPYTNTFDRLSYALSTRRNLKERFWLLSENSGLDSDEEGDDDSSDAYYHPSNDPTERFLELNSSYPNVATLVLHQHHSTSKTPLTFRAIIGTLRQLPSLQHLCISGLPASSFTNFTLNALPAGLHSLRLQNLPGVNDKGLQRFASSEASISLENVSLVDLEIRSFTTISSFLSPHLANLRHFVLSQDRVPLLPEACSTYDGVLNVSSTSLQTIHWELLCSEYAPCAATSLLAASIQAGKFSKLRKIRAPHDPQGVLQRLCKPMASAVLPEDTQLLRALPDLLPRQPLEFHNNGGCHMDVFTVHSIAWDTPVPGPKEDPLSARKIHTPNMSKLGNRTDSATSTPTCLEHAAYSQSTKVPNSNNRRQDLRYIQQADESPMYSRLQAQARIEDARKQPFMDINVFDPEGMTVSSETIFGFLGRLDSQIVYDVRSDRECAAQCVIGRGCNGDDEEGGGEGEGTDRSPWITGIGDVVDGRRDCCAADSGRGRGDDNRGVGVRKSVDVMGLF